MTDSSSSLQQAAAISESQSGRCFNCQKEGHYWHQCKETLSPELQELSDQQDREREEWKKRSLNPKGGVGAKGGHAPTPLARANPGTAPGARGPHPVDDASAGGSPYKYWNEDALSRWLGPENLGWAILDGIRTRVLVDNGARVNSVMPAYVCQHGLGVRPISELDHSLNPFQDRILLVGLGGGHVEPAGFTLMRVQIEGLPHYNEQQVVFVLDDPSGFSARIPVILGTPTINRVIQTMKESEIHEAPSEWQAARVAFEWMQGFQLRRTSLAERLKFLTNTAEDPLDLDEKVLLTDKCTIPGFQSVVAHGRTQNTMMMGHWLNVMMQAPYPDDKADLPNGLYVMRTYTELKDGSRSVSLCCRTSPPGPSTWPKGGLWAKLWLSMLSQMPNVRRICLRN